MTPDFTVCVLLYGAHPQLAARCLNPILKIRDQVDLRIGCNEIGKATQAFLSRHDLHPTVNSVTNSHKYPVMRKLFAAAPLAPWTMWLDDDSYISDPDPVKWLDKVRFWANDADMLGQKWRIPLAGNQPDWIRSRPWYTGKEIPNIAIQFCQGAWWTIRSEILTKHDWPDRDIVRKGGDVMLGALCAQQELKVKDVGHQFGVQINADRWGKHSRSATRGPMPLPKPVGYDYKKE